jgi:IMP dehydrogenase
MAEFLGESRTFSEYLLLPNLTTVNCIPNSVMLETPLVKHPVGETPTLSLNIPLSSAAMQSVSDQKMAIALARQGGISFIFSSQPIDAQAAMVKAVKSHKAGFVVSDSNVTAESTIQDVVALTKRTGHSSVAVTDDGTPSGKLLGLITDKDYRLSRTSPTEPVGKFMTPFSDLVCGTSGLTIEDANDLIWDHKINCLPIIDRDQRLVALVFRRDYDDHKRNPLQLVDRDKRLVVGAAVNTWDYQERVPALLDAGVDVLCIDASDGYTEWQRDAIRFIKERFGDKVKVGGGNIVHSDGFMYLVEAGADFIKIGIGGGAICITREQKGIGRGQASAIIEVARQREAYFRQTGVYVPLCSDGGISQDYHIGLALAFGADFVMMGRYFAGFDESPSRLVKLGPKSVKEYWGEGTQRANNWERYADSATRELLFEEGADAYVPYMGKMGDSLQSTLAKLRSLLCNCGATTLEEFRSKARFVLASQTTIREGGLHDVVVKTIQSDS